MGHDGASALRHLQGASHPPIQLLWQAKEPWELPPQVIHLTLGQVAEPCPVGENLCKLVAVRWGLLN